MIVLRVDRELDAVALTPIRLLAKRFPGAHELRIVVGDRELTLGPEWLYEPSEPCLAALHEFGEVQVLFP